MFLINSLPPCCRSVLHDMTDRNKWSCIAHDVINPSWKNATNLGIAIRIGVVIGVAVAIFKSITFLHNSSRSGKFDGMSKKKFTEFECRYSEELGDVLPEDKDIRDFIEKSVEYDISFSEGLMEIISPEHAEQIAGKLTQDKPLYIEGDIVISLNSDAERAWLNKTTHKDTYDSKTKNPWFESKEAYKIFTYKNLLPPLLDMQSILFDCPKIQQEVDSLFSQSESFLIEKGVAALVTQVRGLIDGDGNSPEHWRELYCSLEAVFDTCGGASSTIPKEDWIIVCMTKAFKAACKEGEPDIFSAEQNFSIYKVLLSIIQNRTRIKKEKFAIKMKSFCRQIKDACCQSQVSQIEDKSVSYVRQFYEEYNNVLGGKRGSVRGIGETISNMFEKHIDDVLPTIFSLKEAIEHGYSVNDDCKDHDNAGERKTEKKWTISRVYTMWVTLCPDCRCMEQEVFDGVVQRLTGRSSFTPGFFLTKFLRPPNRFSNRGFGASTRKIYMRLFNREVRQIGPI